MGDGNAHSRLAVRSPDASPTLIFPFVMNPLRTCLVLLSLAALPLPSAAASLPAPARPNIVLILADDLGWGSLGSYGADPALVRTPHCDRLAREGIRFTDANTPASVCSPTRYAVLTGRYCWRTSLKHEVLNVNSPLHIETSRVTLASLLQRAGYRTAGVGKWHLGYGTTKADYTGELRPGPLEVGFDHFFGVPSNHGDLTGVFIEDHQVAGLRSPQLKPFGANFYGGKPFMGLDAPQREDETVMSRLTARAIAEMERPGRPFFLYYAPVAVHEPVTPSAETKGTSQAGPYGDWIHEFDLNVGRLLAALDRLGIADQTLVILTSDNGGENKATRDRTQLRAQEAGLRLNGSWRAGKHSIYEGGFRVPFLARWPGKIPAGVVSSEMINLADLLATTAALVGAPLPAPGEGAEDSVNQLPALLGQKAATPRRQHMVVHSADGVFAVRHGPWKWVEGQPSKPKPPAARAIEFTPQLFNLADDPQEQRNVLAQHPEIARDLAAYLAGIRARGFSRE